VFFAEHYSGVIDEQGLKSKHQPEKRDAHA
jgi:hypothetical protein